MEYDKITHVLTGLTLSLAIFLCVLEYKNIKPINKVESIINDILRGE